MFLVEGIIAVGPPVTRRPPHRSRRAVFSHRALQQYSLPQVGLGLEGCLSRLGSSNDPGSGNVKALQYFCVAWPRVTVALATPVEPLQQNPHGLVEDRFQAGGIPVDPIVIVVPTESGVQPLEEYWPPEVPMLFAPRGEAFQRGPEFLAGGAALEVILPLAILALSALKPPKLEAGSPGGSGATERDHPRLGRRPLQSEFL